MKKLLLIFLTFIILFNSSGYILLFIDLKSEFKQQIASECFFEKHREDLVVMKISKKEIEADQEVFPAGENEFELNEDQQEYFVSE